MRALRLCTAMLAVMLMPAAIWAADEANGGGVKPETARFYQEAKEQVTKLGDTPLIRQHAANQIEQANASIEAAQNGLKSLNDQETRQAAELAVLQVKLALVVTDEKVAAEKTAAAQKELTQLEQRLADILDGKGEKP